jgi:hypothetical protein
MSDDEIEIVPDEGVDESIDDTDSTDSTDDSGRSVPWRAMLATVVVVGAVLGVAAGAVVLTNVVYAALLAGGFVVGFIAVPLFLITIGKSLPKIARELIAWLVLVLAALPYPRAVLEQQPDLSYELVPEQDHDGAASAWTKWLFTDFAIGLRVDRETWRDLALDEDQTEALAAEVGQTDGGLVFAPIVRNGERTFVPDGIGVDDVVVPLAEPLSRLRDVAGVLAGYEAESAGLEEFGGDTGDHGTKTMLAGMLTFVLLGVALGWVMFW